MPKLPRGSQYDVAIVGGGSAGYAAARTTSSAGLHTVVIEGGEEVGGLCILRGCMPTKAFLYAAEVMHLARQAGTWGIRTGSVSADFGRVMARKDALIQQFASFRESQLRAGKFEFRRARAWFANAHTLELDTGEQLQAKHFVVATGSRVAPSPLPQLDAVGYLTSDSMVKLERLPKSLIILGGGAVAVEAAQFFARLDVEVTIVQRSARFLHALDADAAAEIEKVFRREGMRVFTGTQLLDARRTRGGKQVEFEHGGERITVKAEEIFFGLGRISNTRGLGLEAIGVKLEGAQISTDTKQRTNLPHIYAAGDCAGPHEIVHLAVQQGEVAGHNIARPRNPRRMDYRLLMEIIFTDPQVAVVGLTEHQAQSRKIPYHVASFPFNDHGKSMIMAALDGFVKLLAEPVTGEILGGSCVGPAGGEQIHEIVAAMHKRMTVQELAAMPHYHPTLAEIWSYPAEELAERVARDRG